MSAISVEPIAGKVFGAVVTGVRLASLTDDEFAAIQTTFLDYGCLVFPGQFLSDADNVAFGRRFGELEFGGAPMANQEKRPDGTYGEIYDLETRRMRTNVGNETWHTDSTYKPISSKCAMLSAVTVPPAGGETEFADMRAAYAALDVAMQRRIQHLSAYHSTQFSQANDLGDFPPQDAATIYHGEAYLRPLVKTHPETGVRSLFIGRHAFGIPGLPRAESRALLRQLLEFTVSEPARVYSHAWRVGDTVLWDNRALLHRARAYDYKQARVLTATRVAGHVASELAYYPDDVRAQAGRAALKVELELLRGETAGKLFGERQRAAGG